MNIPPYYASTQPYFRKEGAEYDSACEKEIREALKNQDIELRTRVENVCKSANTAIREQLRSVTALKLAQANIHQSVSVSVIDGIPKELEAVVQRVPPLIWNLYHNKKIIDDTLGNLGFIKFVLGQLLAFMDKKADGEEQAIKTTSEFLTLLKKHLLELQLERQIKSIKSDILGAYYFKVPAITIHWMVIGIVSGLIDVSVEDLTFVVLTHELAHAYTHRGADIDGIQWDTTAYAKADLPIVEGLAQFYTEQICQKKGGSIEKAFYNLLEFQPVEYSEYREWVKNHQTEVMRFGMIWTRTNGITEKVKFVSELQNIENQIRTNKDRSNRDFLFS